MFLPPLSPPAPLLPFQTSTEIPTPEGWRVLPMQNGLVGFAPKDLVPGRQIGMVFWPEESAPGDLKAWFEAKAKTMGIAAPKVRVANGIAITGGVNAGKPMLLAAVRPAGRSGRTQVGMLFGDAEELDRFDGDFAATLKAIAGIRSAPEPNPERRREPTPMERAVALLPTAVPSKPLPTADDHGAKVWVRNTQSYGMSGITVSVTPLVLFPDGSAFDSGPSYPVAAFDPAHLRAALPAYDVGTWKIVGNTLTLTWPTLDPKDRVRTFRRLGDGWTDRDDATTKDAWNVYRRVVPVTPAKILGAWSTSSLVTTGLMGGGVPMVAAGSSGELSFAKGVYANATSTFASATTATMGDSFKTGGDISTFSDGKRRAAGRYRLDGLLLTREIEGRRGVDLAFLIPFWDGDVPGTMWMGADRWKRPGKD